MFNIEFKAFMPHHYTWHAAGQIGSRRALYINFEGLEYARVSGLFGSMLAKANST